LDLHPPRREISRVRKKVIGMGTSERKAPKRRVNLLRGKDY